MCTSKRAVRYVIVGLSLLSGLAGARLAEHTDLHVNVQGLQSDQGQVVANLFQEGDDVFGKPHMKKTSTIMNRKAVLSFADVPKGRYALIVFHDKNGNDDLDHNLLRFPAEPLGYSNGFELTLLSGMPSFNKLAFTLGSESKTLDIVVR